MPDILQEQSTMTVEEAIATRRSVRGFLNTPVPRELMENIFTTAQLAPSNCNAQPWQVYVASGKTRDALRETFVKNATTGVKPNSDFHYRNKFEGVRRERQVECAVALYKTMGIGRDDTEGRARAGLRNFQLFDAPHVAFIGMHKNFKETVAVDVGLYAQTLMLTMTAHGISSCAQGSMRDYPDVVRSVFGIPEDVYILFGITFGYEDPDVPANATRTTRASLKDSVQFMD